MRYHEDAVSANLYKTEYCDSIEKLANRRLEEAAEERKFRAKWIADHPDKARSEFAEMLGWPLTENPRQPLSTEKILLSEENGIRLYRMKFQIFQGFFFYGLYFEHVGKRLPLVLSQHGKWGTPEVCSDVIPLDETNYHHMSQRILQRGAHVFAPQMLLWQVESCGVNYDRDLLDAKLKQTGGSIVALELYCLRCCISYFSHQPETDKTRMGMVGLSYGGMYTLYAAALDTRLKAAFSCCYFSDRNVQLFPDWSWKNSAWKFMDSEIALLCRPRALFLAIATNDPGFLFKNGMREYERLCCQLQENGVAHEWLHFEVFEGVHEFCPDNSLLDAFFSALNEPAFEKESG